MVAEIQRTRRVMVLDLSWRRTDYVAAALHAAGIETLLVSTGWPDRIGLGRYCRQVHSPSYASAEYVPFVREHVAHFNPDWVIPLCEPLFELLWKLDPPCRGPCGPRRRPGRARSSSIAGICMSARPLRTFRSHGGCPSPGTRISMIPSGDSAFR